MPFDSELVLLDGSIDITAALDTPAISTTRDAATGAAVIDLKETGVRGLAAVLTFVDSANADTDTFTAYLEAADHVDMTGTPADVDRLGSFSIAGATQGVILGSEVPATVVLRFTTNKRYVRINATVGGSPDDFATVYCNISPYPFEKM